MRLTDDQGLVTDSYEYADFGKQTLKEGTTGNVYRYTGQQLDGDSGLYYLRARYYDPETGRFITKDKFPGIVNEPQTVHPYTYAKNNPINFIDLFGYCAAPVVPGMIYNPITGCYFSLSGEKYNPATGWYSYPGGFKYNPKTGEFIHDPAIIETSMDHVYTLSMFSPIGFVKGVPIVIKGFTSHALEQMAARKITEAAVKKSLLNPRRVIEQIDEAGEITYRVITKRHNVILNSNAEVMTVW
jgi:RHS repeat-associated protein